MPLEPKAKESKQWAWPSGQATAELRRIAELAGHETQVAAQRWFARERGWITAMQLQLCRIPAATFFEQERAAWFRERLNDLGWNAELDRAGNVLASYGTNERGNSIIVSAHLDTVFAPNRPEDVLLAADGRLIGPGVSDNGSGLSTILALARLFSETPGLNDLASQIQLVANTGEEGEGNLSGMRYLCGHSLASRSLKAFIVLDGPAVEHVTARALASNRFEVTLSGSGGHSWNDYGTPNPVHAMGEMISHFVQSAESRLAGERRSRCSYNFSVLEGGTSINSIPATALTKLDLRSEDVVLLEELASLLPLSVERSLDRENRAARGSRLTAKIREVGARPGGSLAEDAPLLTAIQAIDQYLEIRSRSQCASTDANVPLSLGLPAISIGVGGRGGGAHTPREWYDPEARELGFRRIVLLLAALGSQELPLHVVQEG